MRIARRCAGKARGEGRRLRGRARRSPSHSHRQAAVGLGWTRVPPHHPGPLGRFRASPPRGFRRRRKGWCFAAFAAAAVAAAAAAAPAPAALGLDGVGTATRRGSAWTPRGRPHGRRSCSPPPRRALPRLRTASLLRVRLWRTSSGCTTQGRAHQVLSAWLATTLQKGKTTGASSTREEPNPALRKLTSACITGTTLMGQSSPGGGSGTRSVVSECGRGIPCTP